MKIASFTLGKESQRTSHKCYKCCGEKGIYNEVKKEGIDCSLSSSRKTNIQGGKYETD
jgi:hypothetical protein